MSPTGTICHVAVEIRRGTDRFVERLPGRLTAHAFSFGSSYDAEHVRFGPMVCHDDHLLRAGEGFPAARPRRPGDRRPGCSPARSTHDGPTGPARVEPGQVAVLRTGAGVTHSEVAAAPQTRFVQVWLTPSRARRSRRTRSPRPSSPPASWSASPSPSPARCFSVVRLDDHQTVTIPAGAAGARLRRPRRAAALLAGRAAARGRRVPLHRRAGARADRRRADRAAGLVLRAGRPGLSRLAGAARAASRRGWRAARLSAPILV